MSIDGADIGDGEVVSRPQRIQFIAHTGPSELLAALRQVAQASEADVRSWLVIECYVRRCLPEARDEDIRQNVLLTILVHAHTLRTNDPPGACAWVHAVCRSQLVNELRSRYRMRFVSIDDAAGRELLVAPRAIPPELAEPLLRSLDELVVRHVRERHGDANARARRTAQARAAVRRLVLEETLPEVIAIAPVSLPLLAKWIERGRTVVLDAIDAERERDPDRAELFEPIATLMRKRRADAGKPRPARRKRTN